MRHFNINFKIEEGSFDKNENEIILKSTQLQRTKSSKEPKFLEI